MLPPKIPSRSVSLRREESYESESPSHALGPAVKPEPRPPLDLSDLEDSADYDIKSLCIIHLLIESAPFVTDKSAASRAEYSAVSL